MDIHQFSISLGLVGDLCNTVGALVLARDITDREKDLRQLANLEAATDELKAIGTLEAEQVKLQKKSDAVLVLAARAIKNARRGLNWIFAGFSCLIIHRLLELLH